MIDRAKSWVDDGDDAEEAVRHAIDDGLIYTEDIVALGLKYGAINDSEIVSNIYEDLFDDMYKKVSDYYDEQKEDEKEEDEDEVEESFRGIKPRKRLKESFDDASHEFAEKMVKQIVDSGYISWDEYTRLATYEKDFSDDANDEFDDFIYDTKDLILYLGVNSGIQQNLSGDFYTDEYAETHPEVLEESKKNKRKLKESRRPHRKGKALRESKSLMEGPGAGYTISGTLRDVEITGYKVVRTQKDKSTGDRYTDVICDASGSATFEDVSASSYMYGGEIESTPVEITGVTLSFFGEPEEISTEDIEYDLNGHKISGVYGGGWSHSTFDGEFTATVKGDSYNVYEVTIKFTDDNAINFVDEAVQEPKTMYGLSDDGRTIEDAYEDEDEAIGLAKKFGYEKVVEFYEYRTKLWADGESEDTDIEIKETVWERPEDEDEDEDEEVDESLKESLRRKRKLKEAKTTTDKFTAVYDELVREDKSGASKFRRLKTPNSERYDYEDVSYADGGISVYADTEEGLDFAKEVAKEWNCKTSDVKEHTSRYSKHPYEIVIYVDENEKVSK